MTEEQRRTKAHALAQAAQFVHEALERLVDAEIRPDLWGVLGALVDTLANDYWESVNAPSDYDCDTTTQL